MVKVWVEGKALDKVFGQRQIVVVAGEPVST
jgi:hypothetical protein